MVAGVLLVCGCAATEGMKPVDCGKISNNTVRDGCIFNQSVSKLNSVRCRDIKNDSLKANCIDEIAIYLKDYIPCKQHDRASLKDRCTAKVGDIRKIAREENPNAKLP
jgi:hypothetical protein